MREKQTDKLFIVCKYSGGFFLATFSSVIFSFIASDRYNFNLQRGLQMQLSGMYLIRWQTQFTEAVNGDTVRWMQNILLFTFLVLQGHSADLWPSSLETAEPGFSPAPQGDEGAEAVFVRVWCKK